MIVRSVLVVCGLAAAFVGTWRGYENAREALMPVVEDRDPTRRLVEAARPLHARPRVRRFVRGAAVSIGWVVVALYGLLLIATAGAMGALP